jgi:hypothetical protein
MNEDSSSVRRPVPWLRVAGIVLLVASTLASAAANMIPFHVPTKRELQRSEQNVVAEARRGRILATLVRGDGCDREVARELAHDLVFDGRSALPYADDFADRCGDDWVVRRWANASTKLRLPRVELVERRVAYFFGRGRP